MCKRFHYSSTSQKPSPDPPTNCCCGACFIQRRAECARAVKLSGGAKGARRSCRHGGVQLTVFCLQRWRGGGVLKGWGWEKLGKGMVRQVLRFQLSWREAGWGWGRGSALPALKLGSNLYARSAVFYCAQRHTPVRARREGVAKSLGGKATQMVRSATMVVNRSGVASSRCRGRVLTSKQFFSVEVYTSPIPAEENRGKGWWVCGCAWRVVRVCC